MQGEDVEALQASLRHLGFSIKDREGRFGTSTRQAVIDFQGAHGLDPTGVADQGTINQIRLAAEAGRAVAVALRQAFVTKGFVSAVNGSALVGLLVRAYDKDLRSEELLGEATTDREGQYRLEYTADR